MSDTSTPEAAGSMAFHSRRQNSGNQASAFSLKGGVRGRAARQRGRALHVLRAGSVDAGDDMTQPVTPRTGCTFGKAGWISAERILLAAT